jgi:hypothetical protein
MPSSWGDACPSRTGLGTEIVHSAEIAHHKVFENSGQGDMDKHDIKILILIHYFYLDCEQYKTLSCKD